MQTVIVDYGSGNLRSAAKAFERAAKAGRGETVTVSSHPDALEDADRVVLPGVGAFADCMAGLGAIDGMHEALERVVRGKGRPFLGICVGMQLMAERGLEHGTHDGLGWINGEVRPLEPADSTLKIPHMGWNNLAIADPPHPLFDRIADEDVYFVHSYALTCRESRDVLASVTYGGPVVAAVGRDNMVGTQFHPEKSQAVGLRLIGNFLNWRP